MTTITQLQPVMQTLFTSTANEIARQTGFIQRKRKMTGAHFLQATVFGWLQHPQGTRQQLHQSLLATGVTMSSQGFEQRFTSRAGDFLEAMVRETTGQVFEASVLTPVLKRFQGVYITDGTRVEEMSGGLKIVARLELQRGGLALSLDPLNTHDNASRVCERAMPVGALHIGDLGLFDLARFEGWAKAGVDWLSRYKSGTTLFYADGASLDLSRVLKRRLTSFSCPVLVGKTYQVAMHLQAQLVSPAVYQQRLKRLRQRASRKQHAVSRRQRLLARWTIYLTSVADLRFDQLHTLYRARWQIECLFKRWKSLAHLTRISTTDPSRQVCELWAKLLAVLVAHWLTQAHAWHLPHVSSHAFFRLLQHSAPLLSLAYLRLPSLLPLLTDLLAQLLPSTRLSKRKHHPNASQLWLHFDAAS
jgi:hypothetical protein